MLPIDNNLRYAGTYLIEAIDKTLSSYNLKSDTKWIGDNAFKGCENLSDINLPRGLKGIGNYAYKNCTNVYSLNIPEGVRGSFRRV